MLSPDQQATKQTPASNSERSALERIAFPNRPVKETPRSGSELQEESTHAQPQTESTLASDAVHVGKGAIRPFTGMFSSWSSFGKGLATIGAGGAAVVIFGKPALVGLVGYGLYHAGKSLIDGVQGLNSAETEEQRIAALEKTGEGLGIGVASVAGARSIPKAGSGAISELASSITPRGPTPASATAGVYGISGGAAVAASGMNPGGGQIGGLLFQVANGSEVSSHSSHSQPPRSNGNGRDRNSQPASKIEATPEWTAPRPGKAVTHGIATYLELYKRITEGRGSFANGARRLEDAASEALGGQKVTPFSALDAYGIDVVVPEAIALRTGIRPVSTTEIRNYILETNASATQQLLLRTRNLYAQAGPSRQKSVEQLGKLSTAYELLVSRLRSPAWTNDDLAMITGIDPRLMQNGNIYGVQIKSSLANAEKFIENSGRLNRNIPVIAGELKPSQVSELAGPLRSFGIFDASSAR